VKYESSPPPEPLHYELEKKVWDGEENIQKWMKIMKSFKMLLRLLL
jgi:hypothetical protein